ncbi:glucosamine--fructose-6-phosphate aminotransferase (isomerizing) [Aliiruegeria haliotis]|uniref:Glucosamine--fructose-6-phosphate aminotransferase (Isomerizing) n=1 Tax=Aliiruegeria haliotis TaxID=1280846 RepID=A0A2T0REG2_9RHOB|nr:SIS domain-containing protein [Aliiruegeria haliotis]PRY19521.1 glucosamine--fructose-6-phosphate aminotransferase (isomerizing) [Aliiruegeria haliotis]
MSGEVTWSELTSQPDAQRALIARLLSGALKLPVSLDDFDEILLLGSGTSYYLALALADWMRRRGRAARAVPSCEVLLDPWETRESDTRRLAIGLSRSGKSSELILAEKKLSDAGFVTLGVSCTEGSDLLRVSDHGLHLPEGYEDGLVMLRSFTSMLVAVQWLSGTAEDHKALAQLPEQGAALLANQADAITKAANAREFNRFVFLASGPDYPLALEAALKIQEMSISTSEAYHSLDYRHGPKACADDKTAVVIFALSDREHGLSLARDVKDLGAAVIVVGQDAAAYADVADLTVAGSGVLSAGQAAALSILPAQIFAFATAMRLGCEPNAPTNLSKVVVF